MNDALRCKNNCTNLWAGVCLSLALLQRLDFSAMTVGTGGRSRCVKEDLLAIYRTEKLMTSRAGDIAVLALQGELGPFIVVE